VQGDVCPKCGDVLLPDSKFCRSCGCLGSPNPLKSNDWSVRLTKLEEPVWSMFCRNLLCMNYCFPSRPTSLAKTIIHDYDVYVTMSYLISN